MAGRGRGGATRTSAAAPDVHALASAFDPDRALAARLAPEPARTRLLALLAFEAELQRILTIAHEPALAEIRLQWWRDSLPLMAQGTPVGHPLAAPLGELLGAGALTQRHLACLVDGASRDVAQPRMEAMEDLLAFLDATTGAGIASAAAVAGGPGCEGRWGEALAEAARALGLVRLLVRLPHQLARGRVYVPKALLARHGAWRHDLLAGRVTAPIRSALAEMRTEVRRRAECAAEAAGPPPKEMRPILAPLALVPAWLDALSQPGTDPLREVVEINPLRRVWTIWRAMRGAPLLPRRTSARS